MDIFFEAGDIIKEICDINELGLACKFSALIYFHKYFLIIGCFKSREDFIIACASCVVISTKTCNQLRQLNEDSKFNKNLKKILAARKVVLFDRVLDVRFINKNSNELKEYSFALNERIFYYEFDIMSNIGFDLNPDLPFKYIDQMSAYFKKFMPMFEQKLTQIALSFMDNFLLLDYSKLGLYKWVHS